jgi:hypothetical protein
VVGPWWCVKKGTLALLPHFFEIDKTEKLSNRHYTDIQTCVGATSRYFITFTRRHQRDRAGKQPGRTRRFQVTCHLPERGLARYTPRFACRLNYVPGGLTCYMLFICSFSPTPYYDSSPLIVSSPHWPLSYSTREICT